MWVGESSWELQRGCSGLAKVRRYSVEEPLRGGMCLPPLNRTASAGTVPYRSPKIMSLVLLFTVWQSYGNILGQRNACVVSYVPGTSRQNNLRM